MLTHVVAQRDQGWSTGRVGVGSMFTRSAGLLVAAVAVVGGLVIAGCGQTVSGQATVNDADRAAHVSAVATSSAKATAARTAVCAPFVTSALMVQLKIDALKRRADDDSDQATKRRAATDAATALTDAGNKVEAALGTNSVTSDLNATLTEYSVAALAFSGEMNKLALGSYDKAGFASAQTRYFAAKDAALTDCK